ncbi:MAG: methyltransferase [Planctomycetes bacterium]|nr:methyltransferase [Planctomycetota bacterium]
MNEIQLGSSCEGGRRQAFADGALVVRSRKGVHPSEEALLNALPKGRSGAALAVNSAEALAGMALRALNPDLSVHCHFDDAWDLDAARETTQRNQQLAPELAIAPDPPDGPWDIVALPFSMAGVRELLLERLAFALRCLKPGGLLFTSTDNRSDRFLRSQVLELFGSATTLPGPTRRSGVAYIARRRTGGAASPSPDRPSPCRGGGEPVTDLARSVTSPRKPDFSRTFTVREGGRILSFLSRPGVFSHGRLDPGTRALLASPALASALCSLATCHSPLVAGPPSLAPRPSSPVPRLLDLGCGAGLLGLIPALRCPEAQVTLVDSYARAIECASANAAALGLQERCTTLLTGNTLRDVRPGPVLSEGGGFHLVLSNPPYYGNYRIAEMFLDTAARVLLPAGRILIVTKDPAWFADALSKRFRGLTRREAKGYWLLQATQSAKPSSANAPPSASHPS